MRGLKITALTLVVALAAFATLRSVGRVELAGTEIGNGDVPVLEEESEGLLLVDGSSAGERPTKPGEAVPGYGGPVVSEVLLAGTEIGNGSVSVLPEAALA